MFSSLVRGAAQRRGGRLQNRLELHRNTHHRAPPPSTAIFTSINIFIERYEQTVRAVRRPEANRCVTWRRDRGARKTTAGGDARCGPLARGPAAPGSDARADYTHP